MIGVMNQPSLRTPLAHRHLQGRQDQLGAQMVLHRPTDHTPAKDVKDHGQIEKPLLLGRHIGDIGDPEPVWTGSRKAALDQIGSWSRCRISPCRVHLRGPPAMTAHQPGLAHKPRHPVVPAGSPRALSSAWIRKAP